MSIDYMNDYEIVDEINEEDEFGGPIDDDDLIDHDSWSEICAARGRHFNDVDPIAWQMLCCRGYLGHEALFYTVLLCILATSS